MFWMSVAAQFLTRRVAARWREERAIAGTAENIGWLIAVILLITVAILFASGAGTLWMNHSFGTVTSIQPANVPTTVTANS